MESFHAAPAGPGMARRDAALGGSIDHAEIAKFTAMAEAWWDPAGAFRPLHRLNPVRVEFIRDRLLARTGRDATDSEPLQGLSILDIGCGGGLLAEPLARLGAEVTGVDAAERNIEIARAHAAATGVKVTYLPCSAEDLVARGGQFDAVLAMEIVEHVADLDSFLGAARALLKPDGVLFLATLNRTLKSFAFAIVGAEYILRWLPRGTHDWRRFLRPSELARRLRGNDLAIREMTGVRYDPIADSFALDPDCSVNYMAVAFPNRLLESTDRPGDRLGR
jgi:2-polyprenyl-6-hydroxyphenyl methylase/3-demethylubiquinone-9 3-methyltransferase